MGYSMRRWKCKIYYIEIDESIRKLVDILTSLEMEETSLPLEGLEVVANCYDQIRIILRKAFWGRLCVGSSLWKAIAKPFQLSQLQIQFQVHFEWYNWIQAQTLGKTLRIYIISRHGGKPRS